MRTSARPVAGRNDLVSDVLRNLLVGVAYFVAAKISLHVALVEKSVTPIWPPTGIALVGLIFLGKRVWPSIAVAAFLVNLPIGAAVSAGIAVGNTLAPVSAHALLARARFRPSLDRLRDALTFVFLGSLVPMMVSATIGTTSLLAGGEIKGAAYASSWSVWWTGDAMGVLVFAPVLFCLLDVRRHFAGLAPWRWVEGIVVVAGAGVTAWLVFESNLALLYLVFPFLGWAALRLQLCAAAPAVLVTSLAAVSAAIRERGPFAGEGLLSKMVTLQTFIGSVALTTFLLSALTSERIRARKALEEAGAELEQHVKQRTLALSEAIARVERSESRLEEAQQVGRIGSWEWDLVRGSMTWTSELFRLLGLEPHSIEPTIQSFIDRIHPEDKTAVWQNIESALQDHQPFAIDHRISSNGGSITWIALRGNVVRGTNGETTALLGTAQDIDDRRRAEEAAMRIHEVEIRRKQALELNDDVVQGLSVAKYALELDDRSTAQRAVTRTLEAARAIVTDLLRAGAGSLGPGDLIRERPAVVGPRGTDDPS